MSVEKTISKIILYICFASVIIFISKSCVVTPEIIKARKSACSGYGNKLEEVNTRNCVCSGAYEDNSSRWGDIWINP